VRKFILACNRAVAYDNLGDYKTSISQWDNALKLADHIPPGTQYASSMPVDRISPLLGKALTLANMGDFGKSIQICKEVLSKQPNNPIGLSRMGYLCLITGNYEEAIHWCSRVLEYDRHDIHSLANLGAALSGVGRHEEARAVLQQALELSPNHPPALYSMGTSLLFTGSPGEAINYLKKAITLNPNHTEAWNHLGIAILESGQPGSRECFENALRANVGNQSAAANLAMAIQRETSCSTNDAAKQTIKFIKRIRRG